MRAELFISRIVEWKKSTGYCYYKCLWVLRFFQHIFTGFDYFARKDSIAREKFRLLRNEKFQRKSAYISIETKAFYLDFGRRRAYNS